LSEARSIRRTVLENHLTLVTEEIPTVRSAALGIWIKIGSRFEAPAQAGVSHFIEHMLFQGTERRSSRDIAIAIDAMGGQLDAFTTKENACYYANVLDVHLADAMELLSDIVLHPRFSAAEMERERGVILEELASVEDSPEEVLYERFVASLWSGHPLGTPILGTRETITSLRREDLESFFSRAYDPANVVISAAGRLDHDAVAAQVEELFGALRNNNVPAATDPPEVHQHFRIMEREELEQVRVSVGAPAVCATDEDRFVAALLNDLLGGSVSSRLFQSIREEHGLAYSVYSSLVTYSDAGYLWIYSGTRPDAAQTCVELILEELGVLCEVPVPGEELARMKEHLKGSFMLGLESTASRMSSLAQQEIYFGTELDLDRILAGIDAVDAARVRQLARRLFSDRALCVGVVAQRPVARSLRSFYDEGIRLPGGGRLTPSE
jgi:predicted Zn-dependent peptidase